MLHIYRQFSQTFVYLGSAHFCHFGITLYHVFFCLGSALDFSYILVSIFNNIFNLLHQSIQKLNFIKKITVALSEIGVFGG
jgi:hypothetical protein